MRRPTRIALVSRHGPALPTRRARTVSPAPAPGRRRRPYGRVFSLLGLLALALGGLFAWRLHSLLADSLPPLDGVLVIDRAGAEHGLSAPVRIERDGRGIPTLHAESRADLAFATGFVHAQDRLFQMDLLRRRTAGELAELAGPGVVSADRRARLHRFRARAALAFKALPPGDRDVLRAYARGVNAGRASLRRLPWEYLVLGAAFNPWQEEDTLLVAQGMFLMLHKRTADRERCAALVEECLPPALAAFLSPPGASWDAPLLGGRLPGRPIPEARQLDLRANPDRWSVASLGQNPRALALAENAQAGDEVLLGSNNWAVSGKRTRHGGAIVANDMHLNLFVPNLWYRAAFAWADAAGGRHTACGSTLPGAPALIIGSNTHVAWGFTNTEGDFADLILLESVPGKPDHYRTPDGPRRIRRVTETIRVKDGPAKKLVVEETHWGPVVDRDHHGRRRVLHWVAHEPGAVNLELLRLETAKTLDDVLRIAPRCGSPAQNVVAADDRGRIAWTIMGRVPRRVGFDGRTPTSWADGKRRWAGWLPAADYPRLVDPPDGRLWTANNRVVGEPFLSRLGLGGYDTGARAGQIRDGLAAGRPLDESDMLRIQLDNRALFLARWQRLLLGVLSAPMTPARKARSGPPAPKSPEHDFVVPDDASPEDGLGREAMRAEVADWGARAEPDSVGYRLVKRFRLHVHAIVLGALTAPCERADDRFQARRLDPGVEDSVWQLVTRRPPHLLPPRYASWDALLAEAVKRVEREVRGDLRGFTLGKETRLSIRHPFSAAVGPLAGWLGLDMPAEDVPGDSQAMPRIQTSEDGASQRMAVSPGREGEGYFHMPTGQSAHPWSPHYRDGHDDWVKGRPSPFLPGKAVHTLELRPG
jgi:penicillin amidase